VFVVEIAVLVGMVPETRGGVTKVICLVVFGLTMTMSAIIAGVKGIDKWVLKR
jgi:hypothetical protein